MQSLSTKIDEALSESINILKNDYDKKIVEVRSYLENSRNENQTNLQNIETKMENMINDNIGAINNDLLDKISQIYHASLSKEEVIIKRMERVDDNIKSLNTKMENVLAQIDDVQEKMYDFEQNKRNNLIFYGVPGLDRENRDDLRIKISNLLKMRLNMRREIPVAKASRMMTGKKRFGISVEKNCFTVAGPLVQGCRPVLVTFESFKDREEVLKNSKVLGRSQVLYHSLLQVFD